MLPLVIQVLKGFVYQDNYSDTLLQLSMFLGVNAINKLKADEKHSKMLLK